MPHLFRNMTFFSLFCLVACGSSVGSIEETTQAASETKKSPWHEIWTVVAEGYGHRYTFQAPKGTFWFPAGTDVNHDQKLVRVTHAYVDMAWHYPSGLPEYVWQAQFLPEGVQPGTPDVTPYLPKNYIMLRAKLIVTDNAKKSAKVGAFSGLNSSLRREKVQDKGLVWNGKARKYEGFSEVFYKLIARENGDALIIYCMSKEVFYCDLKSILIDDNLIIENILIPINDLENWREYQNKALEWVEETIIRRETISETQGELL